MMAPCAFAAETSTSAATHAKSPVRISSLAFPSVLPLFPPTLCRRVRRNLAAHLSFFLPQCAHSRSTAARPVDPCAASVPSPTAACDAPPHGDPSHVRDSSLHRPRRKRRAPARPRTALSVLLRVRQQRCGAQASCPSALRVCGATRVGQPASHCSVALRQTTVPAARTRPDVPCDALTRPVRLAVPVGLRLAARRGQTATLDRNDGRQGAAARGRATPGQLPADTTPHRRRSAPIFTGLGGRGDGRRQHLASAAAPRAARTTGHGASGRGRGARVRSRTARICPLTCRGDPHSDVGVGRGPFLMRRATPVGRHEKNTRWAARRPGVDCEPPQRRGPWSTNTPGLEHERSQGRRGR
ncbi:hypothetical protein ERJ75_000700400 [Trypanosoma vivax]|nr:hypothetical protein ERJ75_000700400 [Trypanosoma vivax]